MSQQQQLGLTPKTQLMTRLFLSPKLQQNLTILSYNANELVKELRNYEEANPFISLQYPKQELQDLSWLEDQGQENLVDHLEQELVYSKCPEKKKRVVKYLIYQLDNDGYLRFSEQELSEKSNFSIEQIQTARKILRALAPVGVGARNLTECLFWQAQEQKNFNQVAYQILRDNLLETVADPRHWDELKWSRTEISQALEAIRSLKPNPAGEFSNNARTEYLIPDLVFKFENKQLIVTDSHYFLPEVVFDGDAYTELKAQSSKQEVKFFKQQRKDYQEIKEAVAHRSNTLLEIGKYLGKKQLPFLRSLKRADLNTLGLKDIAGAVQLAPSTISRALKNKYFECQGQVLPLSLFLVKTVDNQSQVKVKQLLQDWIRVEDKSHPYSDEELVALFAQSKINLSRRVIAKYRKQLGIANSYSRRVKKV